MNRIRVLQLVSGVAIGQQSGGAEQIALHVARLLDRAEFASSVFAMWRYESDSEKRWLQRLADDGIPVYGLVRGRPGAALALARMFVRLWATVSEQQPAILTSHSERGDLVNALIHILHPKHPRTVRVMHTDQQWQTRPRLGRVLHEKIFPRVFDAELAVSAAVRDVLNARPYARRNALQAPICYEGIDAEVFTRADAAPLVQPPGLPDARPLLGIVGRLAPQKGHADLFAAIAIVRRTQPVQLVVVGAGALETELRALAQRLEVAECIHFLGSRQDILDILRQLDLFVSASLWEGLPAAILEAMAARVPVVATDVSGSREVVEDRVTGWLAPAQDPEALATAILAALAAPEARRQMAETARVRAERYTVQNAVPCYAAAYRAVLRGRA